MRSKRCSKISFIKLKLVFKGLSTNQVYYISITILYMCVDAYTITYTYSLLGSRRISLSTLKYTVTELVTSGTR